MLQSLINLLLGGPSVSSKDRAEVLAYYERSMAITGLQTHQADRYNSALLIHMNHLDSPESQRIMVEAPRRLSLCAKECARRQAHISSIPELAGADYAAWALLFNAYLEWAHAQHDAFVAIAQGYTPVGTRVQALMAVSERQRHNGENEGKKLLRLIGLKSDDAQRLVIAGQKSTEATDWEPEDVGG